MDLYLYIYIYVKVYSACECREPESDDERTTMRIERETIDLRRARVILVARQPTIHDRSVINYVPETLYAARNRPNLAPHPFWTFQSRGSDFRFVLSLH